MGDIDDEEVVGTVYSVAEAPAGDASLEAMRALDSDKLTKVTEYVERQFSGSRHYFVMLDTQQGYHILTEKIDGKVIWEESPKTFAGRIAQAKVTWSMDCDQSGVTVATMREYRSRQADKGDAAQGGSRSKHYARGAYTLVARRTKIIKDLKFSRK